VPLTTRAVTDPMSHKVRPTSQTHHAYRQLTEQPVSAAENRTLLGGHPSSEYASVSTVVASHDIWCS